MGDSWLDIGRRVGPRSTYVQKVTGPLAQAVRGRTFGRDRTTRRAGSSTCIHKSGESFVSRLRFNPPHLIGFNQLNYYNRLGWKTNLMSRLVRLVDRI